MKLLLVFLFSTQLVLSQDQLKVEKTEETPRISFLFHKEKYAGFETLAFSNLPFKDHSFELRKGAELLATPSFLPPNINLKIYIDSSTLCSDAKVDERMQGLTRNLQQNLGSSSLVSLASYTKNNNYIFQKYSDMKSLSPLNFRCRPEDESGSFLEVDKEVSQLKGNESELPEVIWVLTAGNINIDQAQLESLRKRGTIIHFFFYGEFYQLTHKLMMERYKLVLKEKVSFYGPSFLMRDGLPETVRTGAVEFPRKYHGDLLNFSIHLLKESEKGRVPLISARYEKQIPRSPYHFYISILIYLGYCLGVGALLFLLFKIISFYKKKKCPDCKKVMRRSEEGCFFCGHNLFGHLVIKDLEQNDVKFQQVNLGQLTIGTSSSDQVRLFNYQKSRGMNFFTLNSRQLNDGLNVKMIKNTHKRNLLQINGHIMDHGRYIREGDIIKVPGYEITFINPIH